MHPNHMLRAMVDDRRRQVMFEAGTMRRGMPTQTGALFDRIIRLARSVTVSRHARPGQAVAQPVAAVGPRA